MSKDGPDCPERMQTYVFFGKPFHSCEQTIDCRLKKTGFERVSAANAVDDTLDIDNSSRCFWRFSH
jgi:hypothetical protein